MTSTFPTSVCRHCKKTVRLRLGYYGRNRYESKNWFADGESVSPPADGEERTTYECEVSNYAHEPMDLCNYVRGDGATCLKKIKPQDITGGMFACGVHMRKEIEKQDQIRARAEMAERQREQEEMLKWEATIYEEVVRKIRERFPGLELTYCMPSGYSTGKAVVERGYHNKEISRVRKHAIVDLLQLADIAEGKDPEKRQTDD